MSLFNYSEFGLIVAALAANNGMLPQVWVTTLALAVAISFFIATPFNVRVHSIYGRYLDLLRKFEKEERLPSERAVELGDARIAILGMGRVGFGAYQHLSENVDSRIVGVEENYEKAREFVEHGVHCVSGDASDYDFWKHSGLLNCDLVLISLTTHGENVDVVKLARSLNYSNKLAVVSRYRDEQKELEALGCITFNFYSEAGHGFAEHVLNQVELKA